MNSIPLAHLQLGVKTEQEYYTLDGELLISKGIVFSQEHLNALLRRKIDTIYFKEESDEGELEKILSFDIGDLSNLNIDDTELQNRPGALVNSELSEIAPGRQGFEQLLNSPRILELDKLLSEGKTNDIPAGIPLKNAARQISRKERTEEYKRNLLISYDEALNLATSLMKSLADGDKISAESIKKIVVQFVNTYLTDRSILLNLSQIKSKDGDYIFNHSLNVCILAINIAAAYGYSEQQVIEIGMGALLHDIGMLLIPKDIRFKKGRLEENEWFEIQKHPMLGLHLLEKVMRLPDTVPFIAYQVHERENGKGYPKKRSGRLIHNFARIVMVSDVYEALSSQRKYRDGNIPFKAMEVLIKMTKQGILSGEFVKRLLECTSLFPIGSLVELGNHCIAKVVKSNSNSFSKPVVSIIVDADGNQIGGANISEEDLSKNVNIQIIKAHSSTSFEPDLMKGF